MSEMLEKIAINIYNARQASLGLGSSDWNKLSRKIKNLFLNYARAAVETLREPDEMTMSRMETTITEALHSHPDIPLDAYSPVINVRPIVHEMLKTFIDATLRVEP